MSAYVSVRLRLSAVAILTRISLILADIIVIAVTWIKMHKQARNALNTQIGMTTSIIMLTDGMSAHPLSAARSCLTNTGRQPLLHVSETSSPPSRASLTPRVQGSAMWPRLHASRQFTGCESLAFKWLCRICSDFRSVSLRLLSLVQGSQSGVCVFNFVQCPSTESPHRDDSFSLQAVIISRFLLNLRRTQVQDPAPSRASGIRSSRFRVPTIQDIVDDMGQPLDHEMHERDFQLEGNVCVPVLISDDASSFSQSSFVSAPTELHEISDRSVGSC